MRGPPPWTGPACARALIARRQVAGHADPPVQAAPHRDHHPSVHSPVFERVATRRPAARRSRPRHQPRRGAGRRVAVHVRGRLSRRVPEPSRFVSLYGSRARPAHGWADQRWGGGEGSWFSVLVLVAEQASGMWSRRAFSWTRRATWSSMSVLSTTYCGPGGCGSTSVRGRTPCAERRRLR